MFFYLFIYLIKNFYLTFSVSLCLAAQSENYAKNEQMASHFAISTLDEESSYIDNGCDNIFPSDDDTNDMVIVQRKRRFTVREQYDRSVDSRDSFAAKGSSGLHSGEYDSFSCCKLDCFHFYTLAQVNQARKKFHLKSQANQTVYLSDAMELASSTISDGLQYRLLKVSLPGIPEHSVCTRAFCVLHGCSSKTLYTSLDQTRGHLYGKSVVISQLRIRSVVPKPSPRADAIIDWIDANVVPACSPRIGR